jgi:hypothetical protein
MDNPIEKFVSVSVILQTPRLSRLYTFVYDNSPVSPVETMEMLGISQDVAYTDLNSLKQAGVLSENSDSIPSTYSANEIELKVKDKNKEREITIELLRVIGSQTESYTIETFINQHGIDAVSTAIECLNTDNNATEVFAEKHELPQYEAESVLDSIEEVLH